MATTKEVGRLDPEVIIPKIKNFKEKLGEYLARKKRFVILAVVLLLIVGFVVYRKNFRSGSSASAKVATVRLDKSFNFNALNNLGKATGSKIKVKFADAQKTDQVLVKDQTYTAKNNKTFLIVNLELKNDDTILQNIAPGDLIRLGIAGDDENRFAPDLHNSLVQVSALSTKLDRVGFVIPQEAKNFKLFVGELEGKKEEVKVDFPS